MSEAMIVRHCSPTLAGLKTANMFTCHFETAEGLLNDLRSINIRLGRKGVRAIPLRIKDGRAIIRRIEIHSPAKVNGHKTVAVDIYFTGIGLFTVPEAEELKSLISELSERSA